MDHIHIKGAREHNLKNIEISIPRNNLTVITGLSGSGKSSLAFDTIYAEGQRRYVESLSSYARQFLDQMEKPDVEFIEGLSPAIAIEQKTTHKNPRSTVATITEIYDYMRILFARAGVPHCHECGKKIEAHSPGEIAGILSELAEGTRITIAAPVVRSRKGEYKKLFNAFLAKGFVRAYVDGDIISLDNPPELEKNIRHSISIIVDRVKANEANRTRIAESVELSLKLSDGIVEIINNDSDSVQTYSEKYSCTECNVSLPDIQPRNFSFNSPHGACSECHGLGEVSEFDEDLVINPDLSILDGAILPFKNPDFGFKHAMLKTLGKKFNFSLETPFCNLKENIRQIILHGSSENLEFVYESKGGKTYQWNSEYEGIIPLLNRRYRETQSTYIREELQKFMSSQKCGLCNGKRLKKEILSVVIDQRNIIDFTEYPIDKALHEFKNLKLSAYQAKIAEKVLKEIIQRIEFLNDVGLSYLTLDRSAGTLSGGEAQRIRLATQIGSRLMGVVYVLDEPSIGLHQRDNQKLINTLIRMKNLGNTVIVVEHDEDTIRKSDYVLDMGPGAGEHGGYVVFSGTPSELEKSDSITGKFLSGKEHIPVKKKRRKPKGYIRLNGVKKHNIHNLNVSIPLKTMVCITGVSGSGKSTLINTVLFQSVQRRLMRRHFDTHVLKSISGLEQVDKIISIDQSPIGRTPRSNPATYTGVFTHIRDLFAKTQESRVRGYKPGRFSFNVKGGRCEKCSGDGHLKIEMHFLPDVFVQCELCKGKRYNRETLEVKYKGSSISNVLDLTIEEALELFRPIPSINSKLQTLMDVGLSYLKLGQPATTLSGGEAQRIKLAKELSKRATGNTLYILDEPTTGLHFEDVRKLLIVLERLVDAGNSIIVIEHNLDVIKSADYIIDLGPEGGMRGGKIIAEGTPEQIIHSEKSYTGKFLKDHITR